MALLPKTAFAQSRRRVGRAAGITENIVPERAVPRAQAGQATFDASAIGRAQVQAADAYGRAGQAMGRAFSDVGGAVQAVSNRLEAAQLKQQEFEMRRSLLEFEKEQGDNLTNSLRGVQPGDIGGIQSSLDGEFTPAAKAFVDSISDPVQQQQADLAITQIYNRLSDKALKFGFAEQLRVMENEIADTTSQILIPEAMEAGDLSALDAVGDKLKGILDALPVGTDIQKDELYRQYGHQLVQAYALGNPIKASELLKAQGEDTPDVAKFLTLADRKQIQNTINAEVKSDISEASAFVNDYKEVPSPIQDKLQAYITADVVSDAVAQEIADTLATSAFVGKAIRENPVRLGELINEGRSGVDSKTGLERLKLLEGIHKQMTDAAKNGTTLQYVAENDIAPVSGLDLSSATSVRNRRNAGWAAYNTFGGRPNFLLPEDVNRLSTVLNDPQASGEDKSRALGSVVNAFKQDAPYVLDQIADGDAQSAKWAHVGGLMMVNPGSRVAEEAIQGMTALAVPGTDIGGTTQTESPKITFREVTTGVFDDPRLIKDYGAIKSVADGIYFARNPSEDVFGANEYREAVNDAFGHYNGRGGLGEFAGNNIILPTGWTQDEFSLAFENLKDADLIGMSMPPAGTDAVADTNALGPVDERQNPLTAEDIKDMYLISMGDGEYEVSFTDPRSGVTQWVWAAGTKDHWRMRLDRNLIRHAEAPWTPIRSIPGPGPQVP